tara:strand:- start:690 stop:1259 length:570 start_codon:yes stop_codon:yes gene_type:complete
MAIFKRNGTSMLPYTTSGKFIPDGFTKIINGIKYESGENEKTGEDIFRSPKTSGQFIPDGFGPAPGDPFSKYFEKGEDDFTGEDRYRVRKPGSASKNEDDEELTFAENRAANKPPPVSQAAADIFKQKTGKTFLGDIIAEPKAAPEPEVQTLGKSESELSRRERLRRRRDAAFQFAALQKQGGKAQSGV